MSASTTHPYRRQAPFDMVRYSHLSDALKRKERLSDDETLSTDAALALSPAYEGVKRALEADNDWTAGRVKEACDERR